MATRKSVIGVAMVTGGGREGTCIYHSRLCPFLEAYRIFRQRSFCKQEEQKQQQKQNNKPTPVDLDPETGLCAGITAHAEDSEGGARGTHCGGGGMAFPLGTGHWLGFWNKSAERSPTCVAKFSPQLRDSRRRAGN
jgi:hypothetical protein